MSQKTFHRHFPTPGASFYWILFIYLVLAWFYPVVGLVAIICMVGPVVTALRRGRYWCGHICPRGNMYDRLLSRIFSMFGLQLSQARWSEGGLAMWGDIGRVFWTIILVTTVVGVVLNFIYAPRTWCSFCPMGTISSWVAPRRAPLPKRFTSVHVDNACGMKCKMCARVCPMQLTPYDARGNAEGYLHPDCLKCGKCVKACPTNVADIFPND